MANNPTYDVFKRFTDNIGTITTDAQASRVYDTAKRLGISANEIDKALGAEAGASQKYIANAGWDALPGQQSTTSRGGMSPFMNPNSATSGGYSRFQSAPAAAPTPAAAPAQGVEPVREYTPVIQQVDPTQTTEGILTSLLDKENPYIKRARARAAMNANSRGLLNSSIAAGAGEAAAIDAAMPIAQQDAQVYQNQQLANQSYSNEAGKFNADAYNRRALEIMSNSTAIKVAGIGASATVQAASIRASASVAVAKIGYNATMDALDQRFKNDLVLKEVDSINRQYENQQQYGYNIGLQNNQGDILTAAEGSKQQFSATVGTANGISMVLTDPTMTQAEKDAARNDILEIGGAVYNNAGVIYGTGSTIDPTTWSVV